MEKNETVHPVRIIHEQAMDLAEEAYVAKVQGDFVAFQALSAKAMNWKRKQPKW